MNSATKCPDCKDGWMHPGKGQLDQSDLTYLETDTLECDNCGRKEWKSARDVKWQTKPEAALAPQVVGLDKNPQS
jgi:hypothetical protein